MSAERPTPLDSFTAQKLVELASCFEQDLVREQLVSEELRRQSDYLSSRNPDVGFALLRDCSWPDAFNLLKGLTIAENKGITNYRGSVSLVKHAFRVLESRDPVAVMEVAAWVVDHSDNDYIPFEMRKIRHAFERIKEHTTSWLGCRQELDKWKHKEDARQRRVADDAAERERFAGGEKNHIISTVNERCNAERHEIQIATASARSHLLQSLTGLTGKERLEHLAWDDVHPLNYFPKEFAQVSVGDIQLLALPTKERLLAKLKAQRKGVWRKLYVMLIQP